MADGVVISADVPRSETYTASDGQTDFAIPFAYLDQADVRCQVWRDAELLLEFIGGVGEASCAPATDGVLVSGVAGTLTISAREDGDEVIVYGEANPEREFSFTGSGEFRAERVNREFNRRVAVEVELGERLARMPQLPPGSSSDILMPPDDGFGYLAVSSTRRFYLTDGPVSGIAPIQSLNPFLSNGFGRFWDGQVMRRALKVAPEDFGGGVNFDVENRIARDTWAAAALAGDAPPAFEYGFGTYDHGDVLPAVVDSLQGFTMKGQGKNNTILRTTAISASQLVGLIHARGACGGGYIGGFHIGTVGEGYGGCGILIEAALASAADGILIDNVTFTRYAGDVTRLVEDASNAAQAIIEVPGHPWSTGQHAVWLGGSGNWESTTHALFTVEVVDGDNIKLKYFGTSTYLDGSALGAYSTNSATLTRARAFDHNLRLRGDPRTTAPNGIRNMRVTNCNSFGTRLSSVLCEGLIEAPIECSISDAGLNGTAEVTGSVTFSSNYVALTGGTIARVRLGRDNYTKIEGQVQGDIIPSANTVSPRGGQHTAGRVSRGVGTKVPSTRFQFHDFGVGWQSARDTGLSGTPKQITWPTPFAEAPEESDIWKSHPDTVITDITTAGFKAANSTVAIVSFMCWGEMQA